LTQGPARTDRRPEPQSGSGATLGGDRFAPRRMTDGAKLGYGRCMSEDQTSSQTSAGGTTSFGYREVDRGERQGLVNRVFSSVAERYDLMNDLMSGGLHRLWKDDFVTELGPPKGDRAFRLIDVAGGTGDVAIRFVKRSGAGAEAVICDISPEMLEVGQRRVNDRGLAQRITLVEGNAEALPFADRSFDGYTIAFGIRNVTGIPQALRVDVPILDRIYDFHCFEVIPRLGKMAAGDEESYRYLVESIRKFPDQETFAEMIRAAGFSRVKWRNLTGGVAAIHSGWRI
jgi:demethylmenaquinone methyltransferase/2-methoxy-6-polyprenyl-1,4-benzoquinol methylase